MNSIQIPNQALFYLHYWMQESAWFTGYPLVGMNFQYYPPLYRLTLTQKRHHKFYYNLIEASSLEAAAEFAWDALKRSEQSGTRWKVSDFKRGRYELQGKVLRYTVK